MTKSKVVYLGTMVLLGQVFMAQGCGNNDAATTSGTGGSTTKTGTGGSTTTAGTGGTTTAAGTGGTTTAAGTGGTTTAAGTGGTTTATGTGGTTTSGTFTPLCAGLTTAAGAAPTKGGACTTADTQLCYKTCGPESKGFKSETCTASVYVEQSGCSFPTGDYSCYKIPTTQDATCPTTAPQASSACTVATCVVCGVTTGYLDSSGASKTGYCVCTSAGKWSCASSTAWPCPAGSGC